MESASRYLSMVTFLTYVQEVRNPLRMMTSWQLRSNQGIPGNALNAVAATSEAMPNKEEEPDDDVEDYSPDEIPDEVPEAEVPADEAGRPPEPPDEGDERAHGEDDDERDRS